MLEHYNTSGLESFIFPTVNREGRDTAVVVVKGTFIEGEVGRLQLAQVQLPVELEDRYVGEPGASSVLYESDLAIYKPTTDIVVCGEAIAPGGRETRRMDVSIEVGPVKKRIRVIGDRRWYRPFGVGSLLRSRPRAFERMPLTYERAFGGCDPRADPGDLKSTDFRNPVGVSYMRRFPGTSLAQLPNLESPVQPLVRPWQRPEPCGCGFVGRGWEPRRHLAGTMDDRWRSERMPLLPSDFDYRFFNGASQGLVSPRYLQGGESARIVGCTEDSEWRFELPTERIGLAVHWRRGPPSRMLAPLDTVVIEPSARRVLLVWRRTLVCRRRPTEVDRVISFQVRPDSAVAMTGESDIAPPSP